MSVQYREFTANLNCKDKFDIAMSSLPEPVYRYPQPLRDLLNTFELTGDRPVAPELLNRLALSYRSSWLGPLFIGDEQADLSSRYYEVFIAQEQKVPTRHNWHDTFNALMWVLYPHTKQLLNRLHCEEIERFGLHPRTPKRNRLTHFDECGLVIAVPEDRLEIANKLLQQLATHQWRQVLIDNRGEWETTLFPMIFGHALYEMLLNPFIGLTAKWLAVVVPADFPAMDWHSRYQQADQTLGRRIVELDALADKRILKPVPLLGIPGWYAGQSKAFYADESYFRPLAANTPATSQLPLTCLD